jgi:hypothetical protein
MNLKKKRYHQDLKGYHHGNKHDNKYSVPSPESHPRERVTGHGIKKNGKYADTRRENDGISQIDRHRDRAENPFKRLQRI